MKTNAMKRKLAAGETAWGVSVMIPSPQVVEMVGRLGFDWVLIDCEHGTISLETLEQMVMAAEACGVTPIARPATRSAEHIGQVLDRGAMGVQVPHVTSAAEARDVVAAVKYHPLGGRGLAVGTRGADYGYAASMKDYVAEANRETLVCVQIEDHEAVVNADEILAIEGIDVFFVGPSDLSQSMGHAGDTAAPAVRAAIDGTLAKIAAAGRIPGTPGHGAGLVALREKQVRYVYTHFTRLLADGAEAYLRAARGG